MKKEFKKQNWKPGTLVYPLPAVLVSCGANEDEFNMLTVSWTGTICSDPAMCYVSVRKERHSYEIIKKNMAFVINLTTEDMAYATDWCGVRSGRDFNKFKEMDLTPLMAEKVAAPIVAESPISIECKVTQIIPLGTHDMFMAEVLNVQVDEQFLDTQTGAFDLGQAKLIAYSHGQYYKLGEQIGKFGWSVQKKKK
jgi:flavin reductase (DIM6/NTAB) family NADH-FMN oxidoreductase RutF